MATWVELDIDPANEDTDGFANDVNSSAGTAFTLAATSAGDNLAHKIIITPSGSVTGNYTITGTDADGRVQSEILATDTTNAVTSAKYYLTLTSVLAPSGIGAETVDIGWVDEVSSKTIVLDTYAINPCVVQVKVTGTINYDVEDTAQAPFTRPDSGAFTIASQADLAWLNDANFTAQTASKGSELGTPGIRAARVVVNSYSSGAELQVWFVQSGQEQ